MEILYCLEEFPAPLPSGRDEPIANNRVGLCAIGPANARLNRITEEAVAPSNVSLQGSAGGRCSLRYLRGGKSDD